MVEVAVGGVEEELAFPELFAKDGHLLFGVLRGLLGPHWEGLGL